MSPDLPPGNSEPSTQDSGLFLLARVVSIVGHPLLIIPFAVTAATGSWRWGAIVAATTVLPLAVVIGRRVRRGTWTDFDVSRPDQRAGLYYAGLPLVAVAMVTVYLLEPSSPLLRGLFAAAAMFSVGLAATRFLKISLHAMLAAFAAMFVGHRFPGAVWPLALAVLLICWSRWKLGRHTILELILGATLGVAAGWWLVAG